MMHHKSQIEIINNCMTEINNTKVDNAKDLDVKMPMYNSIEYNDYFPRRSRGYGNIAKT